MTAMLRVKKRGNQKYVEYEEVMVFDTRRGLVVRGRAVVWDEVKAYERLSRAGTQISKIVLVQIPKHLMNYSKFTVIVIPRE